MLSIIIPARNEIYLEKTIRSVLDNAGGEVEVIVILDGYLPDPPIDMKDNRIVFYHYPESIGQRQAINEGVKRAKGKYIMKLDAHCNVDKGFDVKLASDCEYDWTVVPRMYNLDIETWTPKLHKMTDYMYIGNTSGRELRAEYYEGKEKDKGQRQPYNDKMIDDIMCCMGPCFFMYKDRFWELEGMDEGHGQWGQMGVEVACKAWLSGGSLKVNKKTWFAHWFRGGGGPGFPYPISGKAIKKARDYSKDLWINDKWPLAKRKFQWVIDKFNPPGWEKLKKEPPMPLDKKAYYKYTAQVDKFPKWMGIDLVKYPGDVILYQEILFKNQPDFLIETGTYRGGSALFFAHMFDIIGKGHVISIDLHDHNPPKHPRITYIIGRATEPEVLEQIRNQVGNGTCMVSLDSNHHRSHVKRELVRYHNFVTLNQYMVVEDTNYGEIGKKAGPDEAVEWFMNHNSRFVADPLENRFVFSLNPGGWLRRRK